MTPTDELQRARLRQVAAETLLEWLAGKYSGLLWLAESGLRSRLLTEVRDSLDQTRQEYVDLLDQRLPPAEARLQAAMFREAFDEAAQVVERQLGLPLK